MDARNGSSRERTFIEFAMKMVNVWTLPAGFNLKFEIKLMQILSLADMLNLIEKIGSERTYVFIFFL
jgi:hypothetical protein